MYTNTKEFDIKLENDYFEPNNVSQLQILMPFLVVLRQSDYFNPEGITCL